MTWLYLPITSQPRELDSKLVLAHAARVAGLNPVIGYKTSFLSQMPNLEPGVFLAHNARQKTEKLAQVHRFGHSVVVLDEESLVRQSDDIFWKKHNRNAFKYVDQIMSWGENDAALWPRFGVSERIDVATVGNPRFDLLRPELRAYHEPEIATLRARYGNYVLLNTNFPTVNNLTPQGGGVRMAKWAMDGKGQELNKRFLTFKTAMFDATLALIAPLARAIAPLSLVLRPHPNEDHTPWLNAAKGLDNVHVVFEGNVVPWLVGAKALVHNNCTTGVEGVAAGKKVLNFVPFTSEFDNPLFHAFGTDCIDADALAAAINSVGSTNAEALRAENRNRLRPYVASFDGPLSATRIAEAIASGDKPGLIPRAGPGVINRFLAAASSEAERQIRLALYAITARGHAKRRFLAEHFPDITLRSFDNHQLRYSTQQLDLMMRQYPPLEQDAVDACLARIGVALSSEKIFKTNILRGDLIEIV